MKFTTSDEGTIGYLSLVDEIPPDGVKRSLHFAEYESLIVDLDENGAILGFEFLDARTQLAAFSADLNSYK